MPVAAPKPCKYPGCGALTTGSYCEKHKGHYDRARGTATQRGYSSRWRRIRAQKLAVNPLCERCEVEGKTRPATLVHHIDRNPKNNRMENLESLCVQHHEEEHKHERFRR